MVEVSFVCPVCQERKQVNIDQDQVLNAPRNPVPIVITHGSPEHAVTIFIDIDFNIRAVSASDIVQRLDDTAIVSFRLQKKTVPFPKKKQVSLSGLSGIQCALIALIDGKRSIDELAEALDISTMKVKILCEQLVKMSKIESVKVVIEEK